MGVGKDLYDCGKMSRRKGPSTAMLEAAVEDVLENPEKYSPSAGIRPPHLGDFKGSAALAWS